MQENIFFILTGIFILGISFALYKLFSLFNNLTKGVGVADLKKVLEGILKTQQDNAKDITTLTKEIENIKDLDLKHFQKQALIRFNPFNELGGDHSFSLTLLNGVDNGVIITSLHARERTRVYIKEIVAGKSKIELSKEEEKSLSQALKEK